MRRFLRRSVTGVLDRTGLIGSSPFERFGPGGRGGGAAEAQALRHQPADGPQVDVRREAHRGRGRLLREQHRLALEIARRSTDSRSRSPAAAGARCSSSLTCPSAG